MTDEMERLVEALTIIGDTHQRSECYEAIAYMRYQEAEIKRLQAHVSQVENEVVDFINTHTRVAPDEAEESVNRLARLVRWRQRQGWDEKELEESDDEER